MSHAKPGDLVQLGTCISGGMETSTRRGRLVGIRHDETPNIRTYPQPQGRYQAAAARRTYILRAYKEGDGAFPTGDYYTTWLLVPHSGEGCPDD